MENEKQMYGYYEENNSYFDGDIVGFIWNSLLASLITTLTFGICAPWAFCIMLRWKTEHTVIDGRRLYFDGEALDLFGQWIKWFFFIIITFGIYSFWVAIKMEQWTAKHTHHVE